jgi:hypothetical protein
LSKHDAWLLSNCSALSVLVGALFKKFGLFLNTPSINIGMLYITPFSPTSCFFLPLMFKTIYYHKTLIFHTMILSMGAGTREK